MQKKLIFKATSKNYTAKVFRFFVSDYAAAGKLLKYFSSKGNMILEAHYVIILSGGRPYCCEINLQFLRATGTCMPYLNDSNIKGTGLPY